VILPITLPWNSVNHRLPSAAPVMLIGTACGVGIANSAIVTALAVAQDIAAAASAAAIKGRAGKLELEALNILLSPMIIFSGQLADSRTL
jgi:hypothetical protein